MKDKISEVKNISEFSDKLGKSCKFILTNSWHFNGKVLEVTENTITILDRYRQRITISKKDILLCTEVGNDN